MGIHLLLHGLSTRRCPMPSSPPFSTFRNPALPVECVDFFSAPFLDVVQPFSARSSSPRLSLHYSKHHFLHQSIVLLMCPNRFSFLSMICCTMFFHHRTRLLLSYSLDPI